MTSRGAPFGPHLALALALAACTVRPDLPAPVLPLARTPDAEFRRQAPTPERAEAQKPPQVEERRLENGVSVLVVERHSLPTASVVIVVRRAGRESAAEPSGLGALTARTLLFGTRLPDGRVLAKPSVLGRHPAVLSTDDALLIGIDTFASAVPGAIELAASLVTRPVFEEASFTHALSEHLDAIARGSRSWDFHLRGAALEALYGEDHLLSRPPFGSSERLKDIPLSRVQAFHAARYRPAATAMVVVGDVTPSRVFDLVERQLGAWSSTAPEPIAEPAPTLAGRGGRRPLAAFRGSPGLATVLITTVGPGGADPDWLPFSLAGTALSGLALSRGNQALSHHDVKSYGVGRDARVRRASSELFLSFAVEPDDLNDSLGTMLHLIDSLGDKPLSHAELERVRAHYLTSLAEMYASNGGCAALLARSYAWGRPSNYFASMQEQVATITAAQVQRAARTWFLRDHMQITARASPYEVGRVLADFGRVEWFSLESRVNE